ncbi:MAG: DUF2911 domain-containing protein [Bacteroidota bacterium]
MKKKFFLAIAVILIAFIGFVAYTMLTTRNHSPADVAEYKGNNLNITINYCRPFRKERTVFGTQEEGALQPFGEYWRTGANEATEISFTNDVIFNGEPVAAGTYSFYTIPDEKEWTVALNSVVGEWGYSEPDYSFDIHRSKVLSEKNSTPTEQFTISYDPQGNHVNIVLDWDKVVVKVPVSPAS